ncbi:helix-turn-helix domain-containing protein [Flavobacterium covae]|uniref:helix-turn-helix domain-containing protein n=1 Tax=Flavobacterium covae TaxID=2906076 RepID=UPI001FB72807|nr:helix-turn-helix domain-containing protein [Flavobacterium covae]
MSKNKVRKRLALDLLNNEELTQKEVALRVGVTQKTVSDWVKRWELLDSEKRETITQLRKGLKSMSMDVRTKTNEIESLTNSILKLETELYLKPSFYI